MKSLKKGKWDSVCAKRSQDGQLYQRTGSQRLLEVSAVTNCEIEHAINPMSTRQNETGGARGLVKVLSAQTLWSGRRCSREILLVVGFKAMRTESC